MQSLKKIVGRFKITYKKTDEGFEVASRSGKNTAWLVSLDMTSCNCPKFKYYLKGQSPCHHMEEVINGEASGHATMTPDFDFGSYKEPLKEYEFGKKYGYELLDKLVAQQQVVIFKGLVRKL